MLRWIMLTCIPGWKIQGREPLLAGLKAWQSSIVAGDLSLMLLECFRSSFIATDVPHLIRGFAFCVLLFFTIYTREQCSTSHLDLGLDSSCTAAITLQQLWGVNSDPHWNWEAIWSYEYVWLMRRCVIVWSPSKIRISVWIWQPSWWKCHT